METITKEQAVRIIDGINNGQFFTVEFQKRTGTPAPHGGLIHEMRTMNCRKGVKKGTNGQGLRFDPRSKGLISVWDAVKRDFRFISIEGIRGLRCNGQSYKVA